MKKHINIIIFVTLFISIVSIISILIARGYNLAGNEIRESGILNIESKPRDATITINGENKGKTPDKIELISGKYEIQIVKDGYTSWKNELKVEPGIVSDILVTLFPEELNLEQITFTNIDKAFFSDTGDKIVYTITEGDNQGVWLTKIEKSIFDIASSPSTKLSDIDIIPEKCLASSEYDFQFSQTNERTIISCNLGGYMQYKIINLQNPSEGIINLNEQLGFNPTSTLFSFDSNNLLVTHDNVFFSYNIVTNSINLIQLPETKEDFSYTFFKENLLILEYNFDKSSKYLRSIDSNLNRTSVSLPDEIDISNVTNISGSQNDSYIVINSQKSYVVDLDNPASEVLLLSERPVNVISWSPNGKSFIYNEDNNLKSSTIKELPNNEIKLDISDVIKEINEGTSVKWNHNSEQLVINELKDKKIYSIYKDGTNEKLLFRGSLADIDTFIMSENETFLVILTQDEGKNSNLYSVKLAI